MKKLLLILCLLLLPTLSYAGGGMMLGIVGGGTPETASCSAPNASPDATGTNETAPDAINLAYGYWAQGFRVGAAGKLYSIAVLISQNKTAGNLQLRFGTTPDLSSVTDTAVTTITADGTWTVSTTGVFANHPDVTTGTTYYFGVGNGTGTANINFDNSENPYGGADTNQVAYHHDDTTWVFTGYGTAGEDLAFRVYLCAP